ncbi:hypothetical protein HW132_34265, partial [Brasilonema sp. CT11]|nr:hypothetical protein [Brasilonema sp. CT11]
QPSHSKEVTGGDGSNTIEPENRESCDENSNSIDSAFYKEVALYPSPPVTALLGKGFNPSPDPSPDPSPHSTSHSTSDISQKQENSFIRMDAPVDYKNERVVVIGFRRQEPRVEVQYPSGSKTFVRTKDLQEWKID